VTDPRPISSWKAFRTYLGTLQGGPIVLTLVFLGLWALVAPRAIPEIIAVSSWQALDASTEVPVEVEHVLRNYRSRYTIQWRILSPDGSTLQRGSETFSTFLQKLPDLQRGDPIRVRGDEADRVSVVAIEHASLIPMSLFVVPMLLFNAMVLVFLPRSVAGLFRK
jgi:hypothetical protein